MSIAADGTAAPISQATSEYGASGEYARLKRLVKERGLLDQQPGHSAFTIVFALVLLAVGLGVLAIADNLWFRLLDAAYLAFAFAQVAFLGHDGGHLQFFRRPLRNDVVLLVVGLLVGLSRSWWVDKHNRHHAYTNDPDLDLDINIPLLAFTEEQALAKRGLYRLIVRHQALLFFPILLLEALSIRADSAQYLLRGKKVKYRLLESLGIAGHLVLYFGALFFFLDPVHAVAFILVHQALLGLYLGSVFAPNHKGMPVFKKSSQIDFLRRQVLASRNLKGNLFVDFWYGGLNYQIEHHLFPSIPRHRLREARRIVKEFCRQRSISYHETGVVRSYREILGHLAQVGATLRNGPDRPAATSHLPQETV